MNVAAHREIELKRRLLGERAVERLVTALGEIVSGPRQQVNYVYDTQDHALHRALHALRLRVEPDATSLTAKGPTRAIGASGGSRIEAEIALDPGLANEVLSGRADPIEVLRSRLRDRAYDELWVSLEAARAGQSLASIGSFENERRSAPVTMPSGRPLLLEIDRTRFPDGRTEDEVELEVPTEDVAPEAEAWLAGALERAGISSATSTPKIARFYAALSKGPASSG